MIRHGYVHMYLVQDSQCDVTRLKVGLERMEHSGYGHAVVSQRWAILVRLQIQVQIWEVDRLKLKFN